MKERHWEEVRLLFQEESVAALWDLLIQNTQDELVATPIGSDAERENLAMLRALKAFKRLTIPTAHQLPEQNDEYPG